jgi:hypothetical protein
MSITRRFGENNSSWRRRCNNEQMTQEVIAAESLEDIKIILISWIDEGSVTRRIPPPWEK